MFFLLLLSHIYHCISFLFYFILFAFLFIFDINFVGPKSKAHSLGPNQAQHACLFSHAIHVAHVRLWHQQLHALCISPLRSSFISFIIYIPQSLPPALKHYDCVKSYNTRLIHWKDVSMHLMPSQCQYRSTMIKMKTKMNSHATKLHHLSLTTTATTLQANTIAVPTPNT